MNEMGMKRIQRAMEYTSKSDREGESARGAKLSFVRITAANRMQDKTAGLPTAIHHIPIIMPRQGHTREHTTDAHEGIQNLDFAPLCPPLFHDRFVFTLFIFYLFECLIAESDLIHGCRIALLNFGSRVSYFFTHIYAYIYISRYAHICHKGNVITD